MEKTLEIHLAEQREQIANRIEEQLRVGLSYDVVEALRVCAAIARGQLK